MSNHSESPFACMFCGLPKTRNPHPDAGAPDERLHDIGYEWECIPCLVKGRRRAQERARKAESTLHDIRAAADGRNLRRYEVGFRRRVLALVDGVLGPIRPSLMPRDTNGDAS